MVIRKYLYLDASFEDVSHSQRLQSAYNMAHIFLYHIVTLLPQAEISLTFKISFICCFFEREIEFGEK